MSDMRGEPRGVLFVAGMSHRTAPIELREQLALEEEKIREILGDLANHGVLQEVMILSTCNRVEVYADVDRFHAGVTAICELLARHCGVPSPELTPHLYVHYEERAVSHLLAVAAGLDSMVVGEPQILGQMKEAVRVAESAGTLGTLLNKLFQRSFAVAKEVRSNTGIGANVVSMAAAAVKLAGRIFPSLAEQKVLLVGAGEMIELAATHFAAQRPRGMAVANRTLERAESLARRFNAESIELRDLPERLPEYDIIVSCTASSLPIIGKGTMERTIRARRHRPVFMVDLAVPRDIEAEVAEMDDVFLYTIDDLAATVREGIDARQSAVAQAEVIIESQVGSFLHWMKTREMVPLIRQLRESAEEARRLEVERAVRMLARGDDPKTVLEALSRGLTNKLMHAPTEALNQDGEADESLKALVARLYQLRARD
jgi:glutamyl-tRNA reductase